jgi:hypothetical protein
MSTRVRGSREKPNASGLIYPLLGFLDRNLSRFSQPVRDTIGVGILLLLLVYVLNGLIGSTYIRGQLWVDDDQGEKTKGVGWTVSLGESHRSLTQAAGGPSRCQAVEFPDG